MCGFKARGAVQGASAGTRPDTACCLLPACLLPAGLPTCLPAPAFGLQGRGHLEFVAPLAGRLPCRRGLVEDLCGSLEAAGFLVQVGGVGEEGGCWCNGGCCCCISPA